MLESYIRWGRDVIEVMNVLITHVFVLECKQASWILLIGKDLKGRIAIDFSGSPFCPSQGF